MRAAIDSLTANLPKVDLVWGGDWNQSLTGERDYVGTYEGRTFLKSALESLDLQVPTADLFHQKGCGQYTIDHIAVPSMWKVKAHRVVAGGLSDHDAYVVEVDEK